MAAAQLLRSHDTGNTDDWNGSPVAVGTMGI
jgi:hypothetical protein